jgi:hypothetical protein
VGRPLNESPEITPTREVANHTTSTEKQRQKHQTNNRENWLNLDKGPTAQTDNTLQATTHKTEPRIKELGLMRPAAPTHIKEKEASMRGQQNKLQYKGATQTTILIAAAGSTPPKTASSLGIIQEAGSDIANSRR